MMQGYRTMRTITGRKVYVRMSKEEIRDRRLYWLEIVTVPALMIFLFAKAAGMI